MSHEIWKPIPGYESGYEVSDMGRVKSLNFNWQKGLSKVLAANVRCRGYHTVQLSGRRRFSVHRLVCLAFIGPRPPGLDINHKNGIKTDNRLENLEYCTKSENGKHSYRLRLQCKEGEKHHLHKLTEVQVREIYRLAHMGNMVLKEIAATYGVTYSAIASIKSRRTWPHLNMEGGLQPFPTLR